MRLKITLKGNDNLKIPYNYNYSLSSLIYNKIADSNLAKKIHSSSSFKFFTFSQLYIYQKKFNENSIIAKDGIISFYLSSPSGTLIKNFAQGFLKNEVEFLNKKMNVMNVEMLKTPDFDNKTTFNTISPIIIRSKREINGEIKIWDLPPSDDFFRGIESNLIKKYCTFNKIDNIDNHINICSEMANVKRKRISINKGLKTTYHRAYMLDLILEGDVDLIKFAYDAGLGEKNSMGFGMVELR